MQISNRLHFFNGYLFGFITIWAIPRSYFDQVAIFYYDITTKETIKELNYKEKK